MPALTPKELARYIEHTLFKADATRHDIETLCTEARDYNFYGVCVNGSRVELAYSLLEETEIKVTALIGFPFGGADLDVKRYETEVAVDHGAHEIEMVLNIGRLKDGDHGYVLRELRDVAETADERPVKVVLETPLLTREEKIIACELVVDSGAHFVSTGTDFSAGKVTVEDVRLLRETVGAKFGVKAAGGIHDLRTSLALIEAGANRLGTTAAIEIIGTLANG